MDPYGRRRPRWIVLVVAALFAWWSGVLCVSEQPLNTTPIYAISWMTGDNRWVAAALYAACSLLLINSFVVGGRSLRLYFVNMLAPLFVLLATAAGCWQRIAAQAYADGVPRGWPFIGADQGVYILLALGVFCAGVDYQSGRLVAELWRKLACWKPLKRSKSPPKLPAEPDRS